MSDALVDRQLAEGARIANFLANTDKKGRERQTKDMLQSRLSLLEQYWSAVLARHLDIAASEEAKESEYMTEDVFEQLEEGYVEAKAELARRLQAIGAPLANLHPGEVGVQGQHPAPLSLSTLPKLTLPRFGGKQLEWDHFREMFTSMVLDVPNVSPVLKLHHLLSCLDGEAARRLKSLQVIGANFDVAWAALTRRYDNKRVRLSAHMSRVLNLAPMSHKSSGELTRLLDEVQEAIKALTMLRRPVDQWDDWFLEIVTSRLDPGTREDWEKSLEGRNDFPTYAQLVQFIEDRSRTLDYARPADSGSKKPAANKKGNNKSATSVSAFATTSGSAAESRSGGCSLCKGRHFVSYCQTFLKGNSSNRWEQVREAHLCFNCLRQGHTTAACPSQSRCRKPDCGEKHHTCLHPDTAKGSTGANEPEAAASTSTVAAHTVQVSDRATDSSAAGPGVSVLLATALVILESSAGASLRVRALLDPGSEGSFITERVAQSLSLPKRQSTVDVKGVGGEVTVTSKCDTDVILRTTQNKDFFLSFSAMILRKLTAFLPRKKCQHSRWAHLEGLTLADPGFASPSRVDCILGADVYSVLLQDGVRKGKLHEPVAQCTTLGWILTGPTGLIQESIPSSVTSLFASVDGLGEALQKFWLLEEPPAPPHFSVEDQECEEHFIRTCSRDATGRFVLRLPFSRPPDLPGSRQIAAARYLHLERRLQGQPALRLAYEAFLADYLALGHMELVPEAELDAQLAYYLPHHAVMKQDGSKKIRVVFNAAQSTRSGLSLNNCLHAGPKLQENIVAVLLRWRFLRWVFSTDIVKMFRQFQLHHEDRDWLRIFWRTSPDQRLEVYRLTTVAFGTACAPFQALRAIKQLANEERQQFPKGAEILDRHTYVDDAYAGGDTIPEALAARSQLVAILATAGMSLDKWSANDARLLASMESISTACRVFDEEEVVSTLGLRWNPAHDAFCFRVHVLAASREVTKRIILSEVARLYDPLGWVAPVVVVPKILMQRLWIKGVEWDQPVDDETRAAWHTWRTQLPALERLRIPRWLGTFRTSRWYLHGFCDASQRAYGAALYCVVMDDQGLPRSSLLAAKSKVAPIKVVSIPRLELCGALLLVRLIEATKPGFPTAPAETFCYSDSQVTLAWLSSHPGRWTTFVANRVSAILTTLPDARWQHVPTQENPADLASRGLSPELLMGDSLWWRGPPWLVNRWETWRKDDAAHVTGQEERKDAIALLAQANDAPAIEVILGRYSSLTFLFRVLAHVRRWRNAQGRALPLSAAELADARLCLVRAVQKAHFAEEVRCLLNGEALSGRSSLRRFLPFMDDAGTLRVGGRLQNAFLRLEEKHPAIIPAGSHLAELLIRDAHQRTLHGGPQLVMSHLLRAYWIVHARNRVRRLTRQCVRCVRFQGQVQQQQMAPLPAARVTPARPFASTGLDYAGPFMLRTTKGRGHKAYKGYVALFVCMATRAIHLEVVSDCTTPTFMLALGRFTSRRGICNALYSDNGTTFRGASAELTRLFTESSETYRKVTAEGIAWHFIPPRAPHFGGLWEAGVKAFKHHLRRVLGDAKLTFEEFSTLACRIEACLNSRPISPLSSDPEDVAALTPGHFLIGSALTAPPEPFAPDPAVSGVRRHRLMSQMRDHFWKRWHREVLQQYQQRSKWLAPSRQLMEGDLVLISDELLPPTRWPLARVTSCHPGSDGLVRVVSLRTATTTLQRPIVKVIRLPVDSALSREPPDDLPNVDGPVAAGGAEAQTALAETAAVN